MDKARNEQRKKSLRKREKIPKALLRCCLSGIDIASVQSLINFLRKNDEKKDFSLRKSVFRPRNANAEER